MVKRKGLHVISGGRSGDAEPPCEPHLSESCDRLLQKADHYRHLAAGRPNGEAVVNLVGDMVDAIKAMGLLEQFDDTVAQRRVLEYRRLIADLEIEIVSSLEAL